MSLKVTRLHNKKVIFIFVIIVLFSLGIIGKNNNEEKRMIDNSIKAIEARDYEYAREALGSVVDGNNKKVDKLWNIVFCYQEAYDNFYMYNNIEGAKESLDEMNNDYKKYDTLKEDVEKLQAEIKRVENFRAEVDEKIKKAEELINEKKFNEAQEILEFEGSQYSDFKSDQRSTRDELLRKINDGLFQLREEEEEQNKKIEEENLKKQDEEFTAEMAQQYAEKDTVINNANTRVEVIPNPEYDESGRKYYVVEVYLKDSNELIYHYSAYSDGGVVLLNY